MLPIKQYRITSADFVSPNDTGDPPAYIDPSDPMYSMLPYQDRKAIENLDKDSSSHQLIPAELKERKFDSGNPRIITD
jgi:hypothetical protein